MMQLTEEQRKAIIDRAKVIASGKFGHGEDERAMAEIALAALTAEPVGYIHNFLNPEKSTGIFANENRHYGRAVYTTPPVAALSPVKRPSTKCIGWVRDAIHEHDAKWIEAIRAAGYEVNATAPAEGKE